MRNSSTDWCYQLTENFKEVGNRKERLNYGVPMNLESSILSVPGMVFLVCPWVWALARYLAKWKLACFMTLSVGCFWYSLAFCCILWQLIRISLWIHCLNLLCMLFSSITTCSVNYCIYGLFIALSDFKDTAFPCQTWSSVWEDAKTSYRQGY